jgi:hypothetical protein
MDYFFHEYIRPVVVAVLFTILVPISFIGSVHVANKLGLLTYECSVQHHQSSQSK